MSRLCTRGSSGLSGRLSPPADKSISHRAVILAALAEGQSAIANFLRAEDTLNTARALADMGVRIEGLGEPQMTVEGRGLGGLQAPKAPLDLGNSGTGMRLLMGVIAGQGFTARLTGDESLSRRPMDRIARPLGMMGIDVEGQGENCTPPVVVHGGTPKAIRYNSPVASAQVKSAVLLAGLHADGVTSVIEPAKSRDHTERMVAAMGGDVSIDDLEVSVRGQCALRAQEFLIPADFSSAAYLIAAALICPDSEITAEGVLMNPTRTALLDVLGRMGARIEIANERRRAGEDIADITAETSELIATSVSGDEIPRMIDEIPLVAALATQARGVTEIRDAGELRVKEADRITVTAEGLRHMGADVTELPDGFVITGPANLSAADIDAAHDHRIAMTFAVMGLVAQGRTIITGADAIETSFPGFARAMASVGADIEECPN